MIDIYMKHSHDLDEYKRTKATRNMKTSISNLRQAHKNSVRDIKPEAIKTYKATKYVTDPKNLSGSIFCGKL